MASRSKEAVNGNLQDSTMIPSNNAIGHLKAKLTRTISIIDQAITEETMSMSNDECKALAKALDEWFIALEEVSEETSIEMDDTSAKTLFDSLDEYQQKYMEARKVIWVRIHETEMLGQTTVPSPAIQHNPTKADRLNVVHKPFTLTKNHYPTDLRMWMGQLDEYLSSGGYNTND